MSDIIKRWKSGNREHIRRKEKERIQRMIDHPEQFLCLCGSVGYEYDKTTHYVRCAFCAKCEAQEWAASWNDHAGAGTSHIMPYRMHLNLATL